MITTRAPLRIPLGGGGTDLASYYSQHGGFILSAAIDKYVYIQLNKLEVENFIRVKYAQTELVDEAAQIEHPLLREALLHTRAGGALEISAMADVPGRTGMGSSGSFVVALLAALHTHQGTPFTTQELAEEAHYIEGTRAAQPAGKHDHYLAAFGGITCLDIAPDGQVQVSPLAIDPATAAQLRASMLLFYTGIQRESFDILSQQENDTQQGNTQVVESLHQVKRIGWEIKEALTAGNLEHFGHLLDEHWQLKKQRSGQMSTSAIDDWYQSGLEAGALGGKILGAGGGGFLMLFCATAQQGQLRARMAAQGLREMPFHFATEGAKVLLAT
ncbi:MAG: galactokinase [Candidatus Latescibacteria bacterium]|nr:galactokinase [Candidatus Latescibacterota bacterium]